MINSIILYISAAMLVFWGIAHLIPTRSVVKDFGHVSPDNKKIITMEWVNEGVFMIFIGAVIAVLTYFGYRNDVSIILYLICFIALNILAIVSVFTGFNIRFLPFRLCPFIFLTSAFLIIVALFLIYGATERFFNPKEIQSGLVIWLSILGIVVNGLSAILLKNDADKNLNMKSAYLHLFTDMLASVAVLVGGLLMKYFQWFWVDSVMTLIIAIYLIFVGVDLLKKSTQMLMLFTPVHINIEEIVSEVHKISGGGKLHHIHVWHLNDDELHLEAHLDCQEDIKMSEFNEIVSQLEHILFDKFKINHINIQPEYNKEEDSKDFIVQD
jgi:cobalt-zinc-cadmium efflux system protein